MLFLNFQFPIVYQYREIQWIFVFPENFLNLKRLFFCTFLEVPTKNTESSDYNSFTSFSNSQFFSPCIIALPTSSSKILSKGEIRYLCLVSDVREKLLFFTVKSDINHKFSDNVIFQAEVVPLYLLRVCYGFC